MTRCCDFAGCGLPLVQKPGEAKSKFRERRFCDQECSRRYKLRTELPGKDELTAVMVRHRLSTVSAVAHHYGGGYHGTKNHLARIGLSVREVRDAIAADIKREEPHLTPKQIQKRMQACGPKRVVPDEPAYRERHMPPQVAREIATTPPARILAALRNLPECERQCVAPELRRLAYATGVWP